MILIGPISLDFRECRNAGHAEDKYDLLISQSLG